MATVGHTTMHTDPHLTLAQWLSPAYPIGAFAYSHGLEWAIEAGDVSDAATLRAWVTDVLQHGSGHNDALFIAASYRADDPHQIDAQCRAFAPSRERLKETVLQGAAFCEITSAVWGLDLPALTYPVAVGHAARRCELPLPLTLKMYLQSFASSFISVGIRLVPLGQTSGHQMIRHLTPLYSAIAPTALMGDLSDLSSTAFLPDIASMKHETQYSKVFRT